MDIVDGMYKEVIPSPPLPVTHIYTPLIVQGMDIVDGMYKEVSYITYIYPYALMTLVFIV